MDASEAIDLARQALMLTLTVGLPILLTALIVGLIVSTLQAATQVQEHTLSFVPKIIAVCLAAALCYLMIHQQDPVGLLTFDEKIRNSLAPKSRRGHLGDVLSLLANLEPKGKTDVAGSLTQIAAMLRHASLVMVFSDLLTDPEPIFQSLRRLRHAGHDVILFHVLDEAEVQFPFDGMVELEDPETSSRLQLDADSFRQD